MLNIISQYLKGEILQFFPLYKLMKIIKYSKKFIDILNYKEVFDCYFLCENLSHEEKSGYIINYEKFLLQKYNKLTEEDIKKIVLNSLKKHSQNEKNHIIINLSEPLSKDILDNKNEIKNITLSFEGEKGLDKINNIKNKNIKRLNFFCLENVDNLLYFYNDIINIISNNLDIIESVKEISIEFPSNDTSFKIEKLKIMEKKLFTNNFYQEFESFFNKNKDIIKDYNNYDIYSFFFLYKLLNFKNLEKLIIKIPGFDNLIKFLSRIDFSPLNKLKEISFELYGDFNIELINKNFQLCPYITSLNIDKICDFTIFPKLKRLNLVLQQNLFFGSLNDLKFNCNNIKELIFSENISANGLIKFIDELKNLEELTCVFVYYGTVLQFEELINKLNSNLGNTLKKFHLEGTRDKTYLIAKLNLPNLTHLYCPINFNELSKKNIFKNLPKLESIVLLNDVSYLNGFYSELFPNKNDNLKELYLPEIPFKIEELKKILSYPNITNLTIHFIHFNDEYYEFFINNYNYTKMEEIRIILYNNFLKEEKKKTEDLARKYYVRIKDIISKKSKFLNKFEFLKSQNYISLYENEEEIKDLYSKFKFLVEPSLFYLFKPS